MKFTWTKDWECEVFDYYKDYKLQYIGDFVHICHWFGFEIPLICANLQDAKNQIDHRDTLAPTTCTSNTVPCQETYPYRDIQKGNNPMYIEEMCVAQSKSLFANSPKKTGADTNVAVVLNAPADTTVSEQRKYLERRVYDLRYEKMDEIAKQFHRDEPRGPKTIKELKERLKKGLFTVTTPKDYDESDDDEDDDNYFYWKDHFSWRTEDTQFDEAGYKAAYDELTEFIQSIQDKIKILDPKDTLSLLDDLKKWKPSKAKK